MHPESDAEKILVDGVRVVEVSRTIKPHEASGEYSGVIKMTAEGASQFLQFLTTNSTPNLAMSKSSPMAGPSAWRM